MKKFLVVATLIISCIGASAQNFSFGGGFLNTQTYYENVDKAPASNGFYVQATAGKDFSSVFGVVAGLRYAYTKGNILLTLSDEAKTVCQYVGIPIFAKANVINTGDFKFFLFAGPTAYYGLSAKETLFSNTSVDLYKNETLKRFNVKVGGGLGIDAMEVIRFTLGYDYCLTDRFEKINSKSGDIRIGVSYLF